MSISRDRQGTLSNGKKIQIYLLPAGEGLATATKLFKTFAPSIASLVSDMRDGVEMNYMTLSFSIVDGLDNLDVMELVHRLLREVAVDGREVNFDEYFMGNYDELIETISFALKENFGSFLGLKGFVEKYLPTMKEAEVVVE